MSEEEFLTEVNGKYSGSLPSVYPYREGSTTAWNTNKDVAITLYKKTTDNSYIIYIKEKGQVLEKLSGVNLEKKIRKGNLPKLAIFHKRGVSFLLLEERDLHNLLGFTTSPDL